MPIGETLRNARIEKGYSLEQLEESTKIRAKYLEALENERYDILPGHIYAKAFLRTYSKYLGLNTDEIMAEFNQRDNNSLIATESNTVEKTVDETGSKRWRYIAAGLAIVSLIAINALYNAGTRPEENKPVPRVVQNPTAQPDPQPEPTPGVGQADPAQETQEGVNVVLRVTENESWMQVVADGNTVFSGLVAPGEMKNFKAREAIFLHVGNAGAVEASVNGQDLGRLGEKGKVVRRDFFAGQPPEAERG